MEADDLAILKEHTVDFFSFSYYMSLTESAQEGSRKNRWQYDSRCEKSIFPSTDWGWQIDPVG
jgi:6-phospho-beta-glucosidase